MTSACGGSDESPGGAQQAQLTGRHWVLDANAVVNGADGVDSWIRFDEDGKVAGNDGCNGFAGSYETDGPKLTFGPLAGTQMACPGVAGRLAEQVSVLLGGTRSYSVTGRTMVLRAADGSPSLGYHEGRASLEGAWDVTSVLYDDAIRSVIGGTKLTARFAPNGHLSGSSGCNTFRGRYVETGDALSIEPLASTRKACTSPEGAHEQEQGYLAALESVVRFAQTGSRLTLFNAQGQMAVTLERAG